MSQEKVLQIDITGLETTFLQFRQASRLHCLHFQIRLRHSRLMPRQMAIYVNNFKHLSFLCCSLLAAVTGTKCGKGNKGFVVLGVFCSE